MKLVSSYQNVTIESALTKDTFKKAKRHVPGSLILTDEDNKPRFALEMACGGVISSGGVRFDNSTADGNLFVSITDDRMPADPDKRREYLTEEYGRIAYLVQKTETQITAALAANTTEIETVANSIILN